MPKPFRDYTTLILSKHVQEGLSLRAIERAEGLANGCLSKFAQTHSIPVRDKSAQASISIKLGHRVMPAGTDHWAFGMTKETSEIHARHSARMTENNPAKSPEVISRALDTKRKTGFNSRMSERMRGYVMPDESRKKLAKSMSAVFGKEPTQREKLVMDALAFDQRWIFQHPTDYHVLDFAIPALKVAIEPDTGSSKLQRSAKRDGVVVGDGWTIFRLRCDLAISRDYFDHMLAVVEKCVPGLNPASERPPLAKHKYRVVIRCPENPSGFHARDTNDPAFVDLAARIRDRLVSTAMG